MNPLLICNNNDIPRVTVTADDKFPRLAVCLPTHTESERPYFLIFPFVSCGDVIAQHQSGLELQRCCVTSLTQPSNLGISELIGAPFARAVS